MRGTLPDTSFDVTVQKHQGCNLPEAGLRKGCLFDVCLTFCFACICQRGWGQGQQRRFRKNLSFSAVTVGTLGMSVNSALPQFLSCEMSDMGKISE